jgi:hypothetical protein
MIQPCLKVMEPGLDYHRPLEPLDLHPRYAFGTELVNQAQSGEVEEAAPRKRWIKTGAVYKSYIMICVPARRYE